ncbi:uncharacterized protein FIBRA_04136 [Fibroporia radiculosa]|uniref:peptide-methionine (S)-S-oxide reductase n=1 Tax=Fibroporia radiculosa TaxID=599839 RepID=J4GNY0_9APHY|nr:uncharacterized protein FIBRA_04136 [Fibroporia radiculosa]CCM02060.1 predicted protein [Fibroporia radiculosa]
MSLSSFLSSFLPVAYADAPAEAEEPKEEEAPAEESAEEPAEEEQEEEEPEDIMPALREECEQSAKCVAATKHFQHCEEKVNAGKGYKGEDCIEELYVAFLLSFSALIADARPSLATSEQSSFNCVVWNLASATMSEIATFAAGCFWGVEHIFLKHYPIAQNKGLLRTAVGYTGGLAEAVNPDYKTVCTGRTGHAESLRIEFDSAVVTYAELVEFFYRTHDPTTLNSQGKDNGTQYRSAIFYNSPEQREIAVRVTEEVQRKHFDPVGKKIVTEIVAAGPWFDAEEYHQEYLHKNPSGYHCPTHTLHW